MNKLNKYWCHTCQKEFEDYFEDDDEPKWETWNGVFIEEIEWLEGEQDHPKNFEPYVAHEETASENHNNSSNRGLSNMSFTFTPGRGAQAIHIIHSNMGRANIAHGGMVNSLMSMLGNMVNGGGEDMYEGGLTFEQIMQQIVLNDPNKYGPPPASKDAVGKLPKGKYSTFFPKDADIKQEEKDENKNWGVCYDEYSHEDTMDLIQLPCKHLYHEDWLIPWLESHNTCPACRLELPTDDIDYENNKLNSQNPNYMRNLLREARNGTNPNVSPTPSPFIQIPTFTFSSIPLTPL